VKDAIQAVGVPHTEVDLVLVNGESVGFEYPLKDGDDVAVYPVFESFDIGPVTRLRPEPLRKTKFILDVHLGKLATILRLLGFDTYYRNDLDDPEIVDIAESEHRIVLTRDLGILKQNRVTHGYWVRSSNPEKQAVEIITRFQLENNIKPFTRCARCNGVLNPTPKEEIQHQLPPKTKTYYTEFYVCSGCGQIYWRGTHYPKLLEKMKRLGIDLTDSRSDSGD